MAALDDEQIAGLLKAAFEAGRKMEQLIIDDVMAAAEKHGKEMLGALKKKELEPGDERRLHVLSGGLAVVASMRGHIESKRSVEVLSKVVRVAPPGDGCGTCPDCLERQKQKHAEPN